MNGAEPRWTLMRSIISSSLKFRHLIVAAAVGLMILGITSLPNMHVDVFPEFAPPRVVIRPPAWACPPRTSSSSSPCRSRPG